MRFFDVSQFLKPEQVQAPLPSSRQVFKRTFEIAMPSTVESVLISLISAIDMIMVGGIGADAIASVGITNQPKFIVLAIILSLNIGVTVVVSHRCGENDREAANRCLRQAWVISAVVSLILSTLAFIFAREIVVLAGATSEYADMAALYFKTIMVGNFFYSMSLTINAAQKGCGNTKIAMKTNIAANSVNLVFNYFLINGIGFFPTLGVFGAAIATSIGNFVAFVMSVMSLRHPMAFFTCSDMPTGNSTVRPSKTYITFLYPLSLNRFFYVSDSSHTPRPWRRLAWWPLPPIMSVCSC